MLDFGQKLADFFEQLIKQLQIQPGDKLLAIIVMESIGFSATHSISHMLRMNGKNYVSHGTKNFIENTPIGINDLSFEQFHNQMLSQIGEYQNCISVHSNFSPMEIAKIVDGKDTQFFGLMRKSQTKQIMSCFYWCVKNFLDGRERFTEILSETQNKYGHFLKQMGLSVNMNSCFMLYAFRHVAKFNLSLLKFANKTILMEDVITNPDKLVSRLGMLQVEDIALTVSQGPSHAKNLNGYKFLENSNEILEKIAKHTNINFRGEDYSIYEIQQLAINKSILSY